MTSNDYRQYRLGEVIGLIKYCLTLAVLISLIVWAPNQAAQLIGYLGSFILGGSKLKSALGL